MKNNMPSPEMKKRTFLAVYDYGMGGIWLLLDAESKSQIEVLYPELIVYEDKPDWMDSEQKAEFVAHCNSNDLHWDIAENPTGWLKSLIDDRN